MAKDTDLVAKRWERDVAKMLPHMDPAVVLAELTPEQRLVTRAPGPEGGPAALFAATKSLLKKLSGD